MSIPEKDRSFFEYTEDHPFARMYPLLAQEVVDNYNITAGKGLDIGTGSGALAIELAKITDLELIGLDKEPEVQELLKANCVMHGIPESRIRFITATADTIPLPDESMDFIVSRGSIPFWNDQVASFKEINRVLAPNGVALIGCGFSHLQPLDEVRKMRPKWTQDVMEERSRWRKGDRLPDSLLEAGVENFTIISDAYGTWAEIRKQGGR